MSISQLDKKRFYDSTKTTLKLLNAQLTPAPQGSVKLASVSHLLRHLRSKNVDLAMRGNIHRQQSKYASFDESREESKFNQNADELQGRVNQEAQRIREKMREAQIKKKHAEKNKDKSQEVIIQEIIKKQSHFDGMTNVCEYFEGAGELQAAKWAKEMQMFGESRESLESLTQCFKHLLYDDEPFDLFSSAPAAVTATSNLRQYANLFEQILNERQQNKGLEQLWRTFSSSLQNAGPFRNNQFFVGIWLELQSAVKRHKNDQSKHILSEKQGLIRFLQHQHSKGTPTSQDLTLSNFWEKVNYLIRKGPNYHDFVAIHLLEFKQNELHNYFKATLQGKACQFSKDILLLNTNTHYRQFLQIIQRKYSEGILASESVIGYFQVAGAIKEILLCAAFNENFEWQIEVIKKYVADLTKKVRCRLKVCRYYQEIQREIRQLVCLGELSAVIRLSAQAGKINTVQALILLSRLSSVDVTYSDLMFFTAESTLETYCEFIKQTVKNGQKINFRELALLTKVFLANPATTKAFPEKTTKDILTQNRAFFEYLIEANNFLDYFLHFGITFNQMSDLLQISMQKHANYAYCFQFGLGLSVPLSEYFQICMSRETKVVDKAREICSESTTCTLDLDFSSKSLVQGLFVDEKIDLFARFSLLVDLIKYLQKVNAGVLLNLERSQQLFQQIDFCNGLFSLLSNKSSSGLLWRHLSFQKKDQMISAEVLKGELLNLSFTFSLCKLRQCIIEGRFQEMVALFNQFIEEISSSFSIIAEQLEALLKEGRGKALALRYLGQLTQCLIIIRRQKSKVVTRNRYLFKVLCSQISQHLKGLKETNREEAELIEKSIRKAANEIANL